MSKKIIEIAEELKERGDVFEAILANVRGTVARTEGVWFGACGAFISGTPARRGEL
jgi:hypothetical protein